MANKIGNYLCIRRRRWALTQEELGFLLGYRSDTTIAGLEKNKRRATLAAAFAYQLIFGCDPKDLFPALFEQVEEGVVRRMYELHQKLELLPPSQKSAAKLRLLREALLRATGTAKAREA